MHKQVRNLLATVALAAASCVAAENPFIGSFALTLPGGGAGWLGVSEKDGKLQGSLLWGGGSPHDCNSV